jgi:hypothetical protein
MWGWLVFIGRLAKKAFGFAQEAGLTDGLIEKALELVKDAATRFDDNADRREWVIAALRAIGIPENIARLALELAVQIWKKEKQ